MIRLQGKTVCGGISSATAYVLRKRAVSDSQHDPSDMSEELKRLERAVSAVREEISLCAEKAGSETAREIFEVHAMMLEDEDILDCLRTSVINEGKSAEEAIFFTENHFAQMFRDTQDEYMIARIDDIRDVCSSLVSYLSDKETTPKPEEPFILIADELLPSTLMSLKCDDLVGVVTASGSLYSHVSIMLKEMSIPSIICESTDSVKNGMRVLLDADSGEVYFDPDSETEDGFRHKMQSSDGEKSVFSSTDLPYKVYVNIADPCEVTDELMAKCDGIGLFRTEYLYLDRNDLPGEDEQLEIYRGILEKAKGKPVCVRTFDIGSDKSAKALPLEKEANPALGMRGFRVYTVYPGVFRTQIRALLRAAVYGELKVMYPMVNTADEIRSIKNTVTQVAKDLSEQGIGYKLPTQGVMIETPAAAIMSGELAGEVDFFSVGTNDLTQYTYALDRQASDIASFYDEECKAVFALMRIAADNARENGIGIGICGELASDPALTKKWSELGMDYISVSPSVLSGRRITG